MVLPSHSSTRTITVPKIIRVHISVAPAKPEKATATTPIPSITFVQFCQIIYFVLFIIFNETPRVIDLPSRAPRSIGGVSRKAPQGLLENQGFQTFLQGPAAETAGNRVKKMMIRSYTVFFILFARLSQCTKNNAYTMIFLAKNKSHDKQSSASFFYIIEDNKIAVIK